MSDRQEKNASSGKSLLEGLRISYERGAKQRLARRRDLVDRTWQTLLTNARNRAALGHRYATVWVEHAKLQVLNVAEAEFLQDMRRRAESEGLEFAISASHADQRTELRVSGWAD